MSLDTHKVVIFSDEPGWHGRSLRREMQSQGIQSQTASLCACALDISGPGPKIIIPGFPELPDAAFVRGIAGGTLEEIVEVLTWNQLGFHAKACGVLNVNGFFDPLFEFLDHMVDSRFLKSTHREQLLVAESPAEIVEAVLAYEVTSLDKWMDR